MIYRSQIAEAWLWTTLTGITAVTNTFGDRIYTEENQDPAGVAAPYLIVVRHPSGGVVKPLGNVVIGEVFHFDVVAYDEGHDTGTIEPAMSAVDTILDPDVTWTTSPDGGTHVYQIWTEDMGELPPAPPPRLGEVPVVRLGKQVKISVMDG